MNALDKLRTELTDFADAVKAKPHEAEQAVDSWLLRMRNRRFTTGRIALWAIGIAVAFFMLGNASAACI